MTKLTLKTGKIIVDTMLDAATQRGLRFAAAVVDSGGELVCFGRMDGTTPLSARMAVNKAYTSVKWLQDTKAMKSRLFDQSLGENMRNIAWFGDIRFTPVWGGIVLRGYDGTVLGALGGSGGTPEQDEEIGQIGAARLAKS
jgi:uncharacterized protein GlcG (DUF336 family)